MTPEIPNRVISSIDVRGAQGMFPRGRLMDQKQLKQSVYTTDAGFYVPGGVDR